MVINLDYWGEGRRGQCNHKGPYKGKGGSRTRVAGDVVMEAEVGVMPWLALKLERGATSHGGRWLPGARQGSASPPKAPEETALSETKFQTSRLQICELHCF